MRDFLSSSGILTINLEALARNYHLFQNMIGARCAVAGIVKANAYGLGLEPVVKKLLSLKCPIFFVATVNEALQLRQINSEIPIAVLGGLFIGAESTYVQHNIIPVLNTSDDIHRWQKLATKTNKKLPTILHFDTGMNRLGLSRDEGKNLISHPEQLENIDVQLIMTHLACADEKDHPLTKKQAHDFANIAQHFPNAKKSLANSSGLFRNEKYVYDMVRPGFALYGGNPTPETTNPVQPVVSLKTKVLQIKDCKKGDSIGYGASHVFEKETKTATVALGYADGFMRSGSNNKATLYWHNQPCPVLGRISMDLVTIDLSNLSGQYPAQGDMLEVLGPNQSVDDLAKATGTIGYEILTSLGQRYHREYI